MTVTNALYEDDHPRMVVSIPFAQSRLVSVNLFPSHTCSYCLMCLTCRGNKRAAAPALATGWVRGKGMGGERRRGKQAVMWTAETRMAVVNHWMVVFDYWMAVL